MRLPSLWSSENQHLVSDPFKAFRREIDEMFRAFDRGGFQLAVGATAPAMNVAETEKAIEVTAELPGVEEKDIKVNVEGNRLIISGEKKAESKKDEKDWHVEERSYGSFFRSLSLPFHPEDGAIAAHLDKGVLHVTVNKPPQVGGGSKSIEIKAGAPEGAAG